MNQLVVQIQELQDKENSLNNTREFFDPEASSREDWGEMYEAHKKWAGLWSEEATGGLKKQKPSGK